MKGRRPNVHDELKKFKEKCNDHDLIRVSIVIKSKVFGTMSFFTNLQSSIHQLPLEDFQNSIH